MLKLIGKYFWFFISLIKHGGEKINYHLEYVNGVPYIPGNSSIEITELFKIFTGKNINAKKLSRTNGKDRNNLRFGRIQKIIVLVQTRTWHSVYIS
jgi:hypothetical protein